MSSLYEADHEPVSVTRRTAVGSSPGTITVEWQLSTQPHHEWSQAFLAASAPRSGVMGFVSGPGPELFGDVVRWTFQEDSIEGANSEVSLRVSAANDRFRDILARKAADRARKDAADAEARRKVIEAQARLDALE